MPNRPFMAMDEVVFFLNTIEVAQGVTPIREQEGVIHNASREFRITERADAVEEPVDPMLNMDEVDAALREFLSQLYFLMQRDQLTWSAAFCSLKSRFVACFSPDHEEEDRGFDLPYL